MPIEGKVTALSARRVRLLVLFGLLALLVAATALVFLARARHQTAAPTHTALTPVKAQPVHSRATHAARPAVRHHSTAPTVPPGFPLVVHRALERRAVVVVSLVVGGGAANDAAVTEARAGAKSSGSGFLRVNVGRNGLARAFATLLGGDMQLPATLVAKRPGSIYVRFDGYADRAIVAQAAHNARK